jgi:predicted transcriptional regulator
MSPDDYRSKWGLPSSYPMVAPEYAAERSKMALASWLGKKPPEEPAPKKRGRPAKGK